MQITINNSLNNIIDLTFNKIYYDFRVKNFISILFVDNLVFEDIKVFSKLRLVKREKVDNIIIFITIFIKVKYDFKYLTLSLKKDNEIHLKLYHEYLISNLINRKLSQQRVDPFKILIKIDHLTYRL